MKFAENVVLGSEGSLKIQGTSNNPVYVTSLKDDDIGGDTNGDGSVTWPEKGNWGHIVFLDDSLDGQNLIEHAVVRYGGYFHNYGDLFYDDCFSCEYLGAIRFDSASPTIRNSHFE
ncbi:MAG: hypothetical protein JSW55_07125, partial [Chloroflexota bacterium]